MVQFAVICASNQNRSMEGHHVLNQRGFDVHSYGTGSMVRLPGASADNPNVFDFGTPYTEIYAKLKARDSELYTRNGLLSMLDRNQKIKLAPERFQDSQITFDVIITCEERCFDAVCEELTSRGSPFCKRVHVINVAINDNHKDASIGGKVILELAEKMEAAEDLDQEIEPIVEKVQAQTPHSLLYSVCYY
ncbi:Ssu72-like protein [Dimargaris cristalligena]|uniref:RNA polymerase II subunit A C-terminal domain phosphatase SSU72 n=1 Tax=Dimargaris cristalligena TaxID=215637 RepID=A0A4Q0A3D1_9FUNG|nr:Ssu72-like protein [Dimargaris cristalligena]|eukprot:RKP39770.1 Ssu72-like protein [Dimargaris cristalligena]